MATTKDQRRQLALGQPVKHCHQQAGWIFGKIYKLWIDDHGTEWAGVDLEPHSAEAYGWAGFNHPTLFLEAYPGEPD